MITSVNTISSKHKKKKVEQKISLSYFACKQHVKVTVYVTLLPFPNQKWQIYKNTNKIPKK